MATRDVASMSAPPDVLRYMPPMESCVRFYYGQRKFNKKHGDRLCALWAGMDSSAKEKLIEACAIGCLDGEAIRMRGVI
ncbi:hypothetical protein SARC_11223 [Sphaeroforma arctica JP610]|uniref:Uncharacterized protein n=1 Tax=Sphaeroforma arctica JP610 TaxID=667725 RepID=A0A0L0FHL3_9EUKA|nr:hypothetical protein SARC_11223 [Sphaeroforma arctica JP610]KNC76267.1 hypothetical protein SARC_11223 [Sphaeroforma arctica JP610]|eukprot:XP_014150169.1 hypothetical protein SARC_11223 [Sphaeroforma arctica JP610]